MQIIQLTEMNWIEFALLSGVQQGLCLVSGSLSGNRKEKGKKCTVIFMVIRSEVKKGKGINRQMIKYKDGASP